MIPVRFQILGFTLWVSPLRTGLRGFWGAWLCYNSQYSDKLILMGSALLWCFATRRSTQAMAIVLVKCCNAVAEHHSNARRVGLSASMAALHLLQRTMAIRCEACLALNTDRPTEHINMSLSEYQEWNNNYSGHPAVTITSCNSPFRPHSVRSILLTAKLVTLRVS